MQMLHTGIKVDAILGRLNQLSFYRSCADAFYGQCSEICVSLCLSPCWAHGCAEQI